MSNVFKKNKTIIENNAKIKGIILSNKHFHLLPRDIFGYCVYEGSLDCSCSGITRLPDKLKVKGYFDCSHNSIEQLPKDLKIIGNLLCHDNKLYSLPDSLIVKGDLICTNNNLTSLPRGLKVGEDLYISGNNIKKLIKASIGGEIFMDDDQKLQYERIVKIDKLKINIDGR